MTVQIKLPEEYATELTGGSGALLRQFSFESATDARAFHNRIRDIFARCQRDALFEAAKAIDEECVSLHIDEEDANHISGRVIGLAVRR